MKKAALEVVDKLEFLFDCYVLGVESEVIEFILFDVSGCRAEGISEISVFVLQGLNVGGKLADFVLELVDHVTQLISSLVDVVFGVVFESLNVVGVVARRFFEVVFKELEVSGCHVGERPYFVQVVLGLDKFHAEFLVCAHNDPYGTIQRSSELLEILDRVGLEHDLMFECVLSG